MTLRFGNYYPADSPLHRMDPRVKFLASLAYMVLIFFLNQPASLLLFAIFLGALIAFSKIPFRMILASLRPILLIACFAFLLNLFTVPGETLLQLGPLRISDEGLITGTRMALRLFYLIGLTSLFLTLSTTPLLIADAIESMLRPLSRIGFPSHELAMMMSIALRFIPTLIEETDKIMKAQSSRGADYDSGRFMSRVRALVSILIPLFVSAFKRADDLALAMEARCYRGGNGRTKLHVLKYRRSDALWALLLLAVAALLLCCEFFLRIPFLRLR